ncbi:MAG: MinD/ParA family protein [Treponemataceae bacterium]|nr:MAG: MinD/ParA family protein [Treponemataceae bacterium]
MDDQAQELREMTIQRKGAGSADAGQAKTRAGARHEHEKSRRTRIIAVTSGKGGVGKTNLAVNMSIAYAELGKRVILIDGDLGMANVNVLLNIVPKYNLLHVITQQKKMQDIIIDTEFGIKFIAGANGFSRIANLNEEELNYFAAEFSTLGNSDTIIIDTGAGIAKNVLQFVAAADEVFVVTTPEPTAITDAYGIIKIISTELLNKDINIKLLVNRVHSPEEGKRIADRIITIVGQFLNFKVDYIGYVYEDPVVTTSVIRQKPFIVVNPTAKSSACVKHIVGRIEKIDAANLVGISRFLQKFWEKQS